jgi:hypothetical protein
MPAFLHHHNNVTALTRSRGTIVTVRSQLSKRGQHIDIIPGRGRTMTAEENDEAAVANLPGEDQGSENDDDEVKSRKRKERLEQNRVSARESRKRVSAFNWSFRRFLIMPSPHPSLLVYCTAMPRKKR